MSGASRARPWLAAPAAWPRPCCWVLRGMSSSPTKLNVRSGEELIIHYQANQALEDPWPTPVYMEGPTLLVYEAELGQGVLDD